MELSSFLQCTQAKQMVVTPSLALLRFGVIIAQPLILEIRAAHRSTLCPFRAARGQGHNVYIT